MSILIIYASIHKKNTEKIAQEMGNSLDAKVIPFFKVKKEEIEKYDLIGFGSGVYLAKFHKRMINLVKNLPQVKEKKAFIFSTSGIGENILLNRSHSHFRKLLKKKGFQVVGEFNCLGHDTFGPLKYIGGVNKGRPNEEDFRKAREFAEGL